MKQGFFAYIAALHVALGILVFQTDFIPRAMTRLGLMEPGRDFVFLAQRLFQERMDGSVPEGASIFLGDSITHGLAVAAVAPNGVNFGIGQQTAVQLLTSLPGYKSLARAGHIYLMIGTNDIGLGHTSELSSTLHAIDASLPSAVPVTWSGIMPREGLTKPISMANAEIQRICITRPRCIYVDNFAAMADASGKPLDGVYLDGVHPGQKGYKLWIDAINLAKPSLSGMQGSRL